MRAIDWKYLFVLLVCTGLAVIAYIFRMEIPLQIKGVLNHEKLNLWAGLTVAIVSIVHMIKFRKVSFHANMSFNEFKVPVEGLLSTITGPITIVCSISLAKGLFMDSIEKVSYFPLFGKLETTFIGIVTAYLLYISIMQFVKNLREVLSSSRITKGVAKPVPEAQTPKDVPNQDSF